MLEEETPNTGPPGAAPYVPGTPGAQWTNEEVLSTRLRIFQMIHPNWNVRKKQGTWNGLGPVTDIGQVTENMLMRLAFHDCVLNKDGTGGCDGCTDWSNMHHEGPNANGPKEDHYKFDPVYETDNNGMDQITAKLELIYSTINWPFVNSSHEVSLQQSGKSRADLWQLAGLVALERTMERANRACDLDYHARQQVTLLESREKCEIKLTKPLKFQTGRIDCISNDTKGRHYISPKPERHSLLLGNAKHAIDFAKETFGMDAERFAALQAIHGIVHNPANMGLKYTWFGSGYLSNMYFKMIGNKPRYRFERGGDLSFGETHNEDNKDCSNCFKTAIGDPDGNPVAYSGWRASCMMAWNTSEGGPCLLRPIPASSSDAPNPDKMAFHNCVKEVAPNGTIIWHEGWSRRCKDTWVDDRGVEHGSPLQGVEPAPTGPWHPNGTDHQSRHNQGWSNMFAFPWEVGMYYNFTTSREKGQRPIGCPGLDEPFGTLDQPNWPFRNKGSPIWASPAMQCGLNEYAPEGKPLYQIVDDFAADNEYWAEKFMEGWQMMISNGYTAGQLRDGPEAGWLGYYSLTEQGVNIEDFEAYIAENSPVTFTDPQANPFICGHRGHAGNSCGIKMLTGFAGYPWFKGSGDDVPAW